MIIIGEKLNGFIPATLKAIETKDDAYVKELAEKQAKYGSAYIDVCAGTDPQNEHETLEWLMKLVQEATDVPISIDSSDVSTIIDMIPHAKKPGLINSVSGEGEKCDKLFPVIAETEWNVVVLTCDDANGIPTDPEVKAQIAGDIIAKAGSYGIDQKRLFIDPLVTTLATMNDAFASFGDAVRIIKERYPEVHITSGLSNISYGLPYRRSINRVFLTLAMAAGMDSAIIDPTAEDMRAAIFATEALLGQDNYCMNYLKAFKSGKIGPAK
ncbi:MAG: methyltetrahydrofolate cobalamin methyltransferase [Clostridiales Family XIII bacterium]|jgi:5-methyltetrahydrofolate--homocysteine methyltransferase|nr:methyltetrahydrofolate cobalamin methyltransferase [Clostridiales Family XIII bacterium]